MTNQESQIVNINLYFIVSNEYNSEDDCGEDMCHSYNVSKFIFT